MLRVGYSVESLMQEPARPVLVEGVRSIAHMSRTLSGCLVLAVLFALVTVAPTLAYTGFCFSDKRFWSDQEFFDVAISQVIRQPTHNFQDPRTGEFKSAAVVPYESVDQFRSEGCSGTRMECWRFCRGQR